ncbi:TPA: DUF2345 domain-containing protein, partial [Stenotrophomonas maltophilia]|nr:DUF2345 domain-containing protein [Stenotrophomonas maltophilia]
RITGQLYNGEVAPPFGGGIDENARHPGVLSGLHTQAHDGSGTQQWLMDDTPGQLRTRLHSSLADSRLELGYLIAHQDTARGALRGEGFELATQGWGNVHASEGLLLSASLQERAASTVMDNASVVAQLKGAERSLEQMQQTLAEQQVPGLAEFERTKQLREQIDPKAQGRYTGDVNGQSAMKPGSDGRSPGEQPVERLGTPLLVAEAPHHVAWTTAASAVAYAGQNLQMTVQQDLHVSAGETLATVSGEHVSLFAQSGPLRVIAAQGPVSLQANDGELELLSDQALTITATDERIDVLAQTKVVLQAGSSAITLEGGNITFSCPGEFKVKAGEHPFMGADTNPAIPEHLPRGTQLVPQQFGLRLVEQFGLQGLAGKPYTLDIGGQRFEGELGSDGSLMHEMPEGAKQAKLKVFPFGADNHPWEWTLDLAAQKQTDEHTGLQSRLKNLGFYDGAVDGDFGQLSRMAMQRFHQARELVGLNTPSLPGVTSLGKDHDI